MMSESTHTVFVSSATGYQGLALSKSLRGIGWNVRATTRDLTSPAAVELMQIGVQLEEANWDSLGVFQELIKGCDKLWLCLLPDPEHPSREHQQCANMLAIAKAADVKQVVASTTVAVAQLEAKVCVHPGSFISRHMLNKKAVEILVEEGGFDHFTILRPSFFMANFLVPKVWRYEEIRQHRRWTSSMTTETQLPILDHLDIAKFAVTAFQNPEMFHGRKIGLASDQMGIQEMLDLLSEAADQPGTVKAYFMTDEEIEAQAQGKGFASTNKVLRTSSNHINFNELRKIVPSLTSFQDFLAREKETVIRTYPPKNE